MKQLLFDMTSGEPWIEDVPAPTPSGARVLVRTTRSLISVGTERNILEDAQSSLVAKARRHPDRVRQVLEKVRSEGLLETVRVVRGKLSEPKALGYCNAGVVTAAGPDAHGFRAGDRVVSNSPHAEFVSAPPNLCAKIPEGVSDDEAAFAVLGSIALQGIRLVSPSFGETVAVIGLGVIGQIATQLLSASGCRVLAFDPQERRRALARGWVAAAFDPMVTDSAEAALAGTGGLGVDAVVITASSAGDDIIREAASMSRKRGRIVLVGVVGLRLDRNLFYEKELTFQVSCSYGPGRYDAAYEDGADYPAAFVRWTARRNMEAVLEAMRSGRLDVKPLIERRAPFAQAVQTYRDLMKNGEALGVLFEYSSTPDPGHSIAVSGKASAGASAGSAIGVIGAGNFARSTLLPALRRVGADIACIADHDGASAADAARSFKAGRATTEHREILSDPAVGTVFILTRHDQHAALVREALAAGKHVFVEKPLALSEEELCEVEAAAADALGHLMVGFNRRFSPHTQECLGLLSARLEPLAMTMTVNAGAIPPSSWVHDPKVGGGRIVGEACHFIDLMACLSGSPVVSVSAARQGSKATLPEDKVSILLTFGDGSVGTVNYFTNGPQGYPKETLDIFCEGKALRVDDFRQTVGWGWKGFTAFKTPGQDKGHANECGAFLESVRTGTPCPISLEQLANSTRASFAAVRSVREQRVVVLAEKGGGFSRP